MLSLGQKTSIFSRLFSRKKKNKDKNKVVTPPPPPPVVSATSSSDAASEGRGEKEYGTFSAQFPPPEWVWYHQQLEKQKRTETWVTQQSTKTGNPSQPTKITARPPPGIKCGASQDHFHLIPGKSVTSVNNGHVDYMTMIAAGGHKDKIIINNDAVKEVYNGEFLKPHPIRADNLYESFRNPPGVKLWHHNLKSRDFERTNEDRKQQQHPSEYAVIDQGDSTTFHESNVYHSVSALSPVAHLSDESTYAKLIEQPKLGPLHSTPRYEQQSDRTSYRVEGHEARDRIYGPPDHSHRRKAHRARRRPHRTYSYFDGHGDDISYEYKGRLLNKNSSRAQSRDSGVNCVGLVSAEDQARRQCGPVYENTSSKHKPHQPYHTACYRNKNSNHLHPACNHVHFETNSTAASENTNLNPVYIDSVTNSAAYQSDITNSAYNSVVYSTNITDTIGGPSSIYHTITNSSLEFSEVPLPQHSLASTFYKENDIEPSNIIICKAEINPKAPQDVVECHNSSETVIPKGERSSTEVPNSSGSPPGQIVKESEEATSPDDNTYRDSQKMKEAPCGGVENNGDGGVCDKDHCASCEGLESEKIQNCPGLLSEGKSNKGIFSQSAVVSTVKQHEVVGGNDNVVSDSGFSSPRNPEKPLEEKAETSEKPKPASENSNGLNSQEYVCPQHGHQNSSDSSNNNQSSANSSSGHHSNTDACIVIGSEHQNGSGSDNGDSSNGAVLVQNTCKRTDLQKQLPKVKHSFSHNCLKSFNHIQSLQPPSQNHYHHSQHHHPQLHQNLVHHYQPAAKIVPHPDACNSTANIMYIEQNCPTGIPVHRNSQLNHQKPQNTGKPKRERPRSVDLWKSSAPSDLHRFEEEQLSKKYGANGEFEVMGVL